jgi:hypothetical protein
MDISEEDLKKLPFDIKCNDFIGTYPKLQSIPEFREKGGIKKFNNLLCYIILLYSPNTPLLQIQDYAERRQYALDLSKAYKDDLENSSSFVLGYLRLQKNDKWTTLSVYRESKFNLFLRLHSDETRSGERTGAILDNIDKLDTRIASLLADITNDDKKLESKVIEQIEEEHLSDLRPESRVANVLAGKPALGYNIYKRRGRPKKTE